MGVLPAVCLCAIDYCDILMANQIGHTAGCPTPRLTLITTENNSNALVVAKNHTLVDETDK
jgi:hypothetical protein